GGRATRLLSDFDYCEAGTKFYVGPNATGAGDDDRPGRSKESSLATMTKALTLVTASKGDTIFLLPGHAETISAAAGIAIDKAGVNIVGIGNGSLQPTITFDTAAAADLDIDAANVAFYGVHFRANVADIVAAIDVNADDFALRRCRFSDVATAMNAKIWVQDALATASDRITIEDCYVTASDAANTHFVNFAGTGDGHRVNRNTLIGDWGTMAIGGAGIVTNITVLDNMISNAATDADACINLPATSTGIVMRNLCCGGAADANGITATACALAENYYSIVGEDKNAILDPIAT
ncbi:hypothetical protein KA005_18415, partial [bacterium]|nr:hypothetical protein [bacterium]